MAELKPCPFCGSKLVLIIKSDNPYLYFPYSSLCDNCGASARPGRTKAGAIEEWNRRADDGKAD